MPSNINRNEGSHTFFVRLCLTTYTSCWDPDQSIGQDYALEINPKTEKESIVRRNSGVRKEDEVEKGGIATTANKTESVQKT